MTNTYDVLNRLSTKAPTGQPTVTYQYDLANRLAQVSKPIVVGDPSSGVTQFFFDTAGRFFKEQCPDGKTVTHVLDGNGNFTKTTWPDSYFVDRVFDQMNRLMDIKLNGSLTVAAHFDYNELSQRTQLTYSNGATVVYNPRLNGDLTGITHNFVGSNLSLTYGFNNVAEPIAASATDGTFIWHPSGAGSISYGTADSVNKYPTVGGVAQTYDGNKNLTGDGTWTYVFDTENHLLTANATGVSASMVYDPMHRQSQKTVGAVKSRYIYSGWQRIADYDGVTDTLQNRYVYGTGLDEPLIQVSSAGVLTFLHADKMGTIVAVTNASGAIANKNLYSQFGEIVSLGGTTFGFTGQRYDTELGLYYYKHRYYNPKLGRFLQPDPAGFISPDLNLYQYCLNSPLKYSDPTGEYWVVVVFVLTIVIPVLTGCGKVTTKEVQVKRTETFWVEPGPENDHQGGHPGDQDMPSDTFEDRKNNQGYRGLRDMSNTPGSHRNRGQTPGQSTPPTNTTPPQQGQGGYPPANPQGQGYPQSYPVPTQTQQQTTIGPDGRQRVAAPR